MKFRGAGGARAVYTSAPTRGPWIEMSVIMLAVTAVIVGPHTGAVD